MKARNNLETLYKGCTAIFDSMYGKVRVKVDAIVGEAGVAGQQIVQFTLLEPLADEPVGASLSQPALWIKPLGAKNNDYMVEV
jgi:hypothetical protein